MTHANHAAIARLENDIENRFAEAIAEQQAEPEPYHLTASQLSARLSPYERLQIEELASTAYNVRERLTPEAGRAFDRLYYDAGESATERALHRLACRWQIPCHARRGGCHFVLEEVLEALANGAPPKDTDDALAEHFEYVAECEKADSLKRINSPGLN